MSQLNTETVIEKLWCGTLTELDNNIQKHSAILKITVKDSGVTDEHTLKLESISKLEILYDHPNTEWDYIELTEIELTKENNTFKLICDLWSSGKLEIHCKNIFLNNEEVQWTPPCNGN